MPGERITVRSNFCGLEFTFIFDHEQGRDSHLWSFADEDPMAGAVATLEVGAASGA